MFKSRPSASDYYLASREASPMLVGLSAFSTNNSGYMFVAFMGYTYVVGADAVWLLIGWIVGDLKTSLFVHGKLRAISQDKGALTFAQALASWGGENFKIIRIVVALTSLIFLSIYAAAQLSAGGKSLEALFDLPTIWGALLVAVMVAAYCFAGGIRASLWTDGAQTLVMVVAMGILAITAIANLGGVAASIDALNVYPDRLNILPSGELLFDSVLVFILSWMIAGFCAVGQPHIMVRFMAMRDSNQIAAVRAWYYGTYALFGVFAMIVGLLTKVYFPDIGEGDAEFILPQMAQILLPDIMVGLMLAGIFAAIMSTADSLLLSCSASITHDLLPEKFESPLEMKLATLGVTVFVFCLAWYAIEFGGQNVFRLVQFAWSGMGAAFGPLLLVLSLRQPLDYKISLAMIVTGLTVVVSWTQLGLPLGNANGEAAFNEGLAGVTAAFVLYGVWRATIGRNHRAVTKTLTP